MATMAIAMMAINATISRSLGEDPPPRFGVVGSSPSDRLIASCPSSFASAS
ncbi:MAG: hypothetical protein UZ13_03666 [Chloroflexi bacterium OLB13]|nr:MAG: hypothetical protein UZ13_03666 [Chloroflexi bacterium OLB13]